MPPLFSAFFQDLRYALRILLKSPVFTFVAAVTLALGIGANVATFSVVYAVLLRPLPFPQSDQLVRIFDDLRGPNDKDIGMSAPELWDLQDRSGAFQYTSAVAPSNCAIGGGDRTVRAESLVTSPDYFTLLGAQPELGRVYTPRDATPGFLDTVVISDAFWHSYYGSDPQIVGRKMRLDSDLYTIIGVMPPNFRHPGRTLDTDTDVWLAAGLQGTPFPTPPDRTARILPGAIGRLKPGITVAQAQQQVDSFVAELSREYPTAYPASAAWKIRLVSIKEDLVGPQRTELFILLGSVAFVLLIACVNIANLLLARASGRRREIAIRLTMGASRSRLIGQMLTESTLLSLISGVIALLTVLLLKDAILALAPSDIPRLNEVGVNTGVLFFTFFISIVTGVLFGLAPALQSAHATQVENLREGGRGSGLGRRHTRLSRLLVVSEVALSIILLAGAGLLLRSFWHVLQVHPGFNPTRLTTVQIWIPISNDAEHDPYNVVANRARVLENVYQRASALPGVEQASVAGNDTLPMNSGRNYSPFTIAGRPHASEGGPTADIAVVDMRYFRTMGVPLLSGRNFSPTDTDITQTVGVVDETLARRYWPNSSPIGARITFGFGAGLKGMDIIGVVGDIKSDGFESPNVPHIYVPMGQFAPVNAVVFLRAKVGVGNLGEAVRHEVEEIDPNLPVHSISTMDQVISRSMADRRFSLQLLGIFAAVALLLAAIGVYGVMSYSFSQRTHELGIRVALGAQRFDILRMVLGEGMRIVLIGLLSGLVGAAIVTRVFQSMLFQVDSADPATFITVSAILTAVALLACYIPAQRATRVDPILALRNE